VSVLSKPYSFVNGPSINYGALLAITPIDDMISRPVRQKSASGPGGPSGAVSTRCVTGSTAAST
jgi:hypothetical protein